MLNDDLIELYILYEEAEQMKTSIKEMRSAVKLVSKEMDEIKSRILQELKNINHKFAKYKNMSVSINTKTRHAKLSPDKLYKLLEDVVDADNMNTEEKCQKILQATRSQPVGREPSLKIKIEKN